MGQFEDDWRKWIRLGSYQVFSLRNGKEAGKYLSTELGLIIDRETWEQIKAEVDAFFAAEPDEWIDDFNSVVVDRYNNPPRHERAPKVRKPQPGYIYLLYSEDGHYKIGKAKDPANRARLIDLKSPYNIQLVHSFPAADMAQAEAYLHERFAEKRVNGEWFRLTNEDVAYIQSLTEL